MNGDVNGDVKCDVNNDVIGEVNNDVTILLHPDVIKRLFFFGWLASLFLFSCVMRAALNCRLLSLAGAESNRIDSSCGATAVAANCSVKLSTSHTSSKTAVIHLSFLGHCLFVAFDRQIFHFLQPRSSDFHSLLACHV